MKEVKTYNFLEGNINIFSVEMKTVSQNKKKTISLSLYSMN